MVAIKTSFIVSTLVLIAVVHYSSANQYYIDKCKEFLQETDLFYMEDGDGLKNFKHSFKTLSMAKINILFGTNGNINDLNELLSNHYFTNIYMNHGVDFSEAKMPKEWCQDTSEVVSILHTIELSHNFTWTKKFVDFTPLPKLCETFITNVLFDGVVSSNINGAFERIYFNWTREGILNYKNKVLLPDLAELIAAYGLDDDFFTEHFLIQYFVHFENIIDRLEPGTPGLKKTFKSVGQFCDNEGYKLLMKHM